MDKSYQSNEFQITTVKTPITMTKEESLFYQFASKRLRKSVLVKLDSYR